MKIRASVRNSTSDHAVAVATDGLSKEIRIPPKSAGRGSSVNGGELLLAALATCYCNDLFREAGRLGIALDEVEVAASADFPGIGLGAENIRYSARIKSAASADRIAELLAVTDQVAEIHNTVRAGAPVAQQEWGAGPDPLGSSG